MCFAVGERFGVGVSFWGVPVLFPFGEWGTVIGPFLGRFALQRFSSKVARRESSAVSSAVAAPERASPPAMAAGAANNVWRASRR